MAREVAPSHFPLPCNLVKCLFQLAPRAGFEPATNRLTAGCSTAELPGNKSQARVRRCAYNKSYRAMKASSEAFPRRLPGTWCLFMGTPSHGRKPLRPAILPSGDAALDPIVQVLHNGGRSMTRSSPCWCSTLPTYRRSFLDRFKDKLWICVRGRLIRVKCANVPHSTAEILSVVPSSQTCAGP